MRNSIMSVLLILLSFPSWSADFNKGVVAADNGDYSTALREWMPLAENGVAEAQFNIGWMYYNGHGVTQDYRNAAKWFSASAAQGMVEAEYNIGVMYRTGVGVLQDYDTAVKWFIRAAEKGHSDAQHNLGGMYLAGRGVPTNLVRAHMWLNIAASLGDKVASESRDTVAEVMTPEDISKAQQLARECVAKNYKGC